MEIIMDLSRIAGVIDVEKTTAACVAVFGAGASAGLTGNLARCGVGHFKLFEFDLVSPSNIARQHHDATDIGRLKGQALSDAIHRINPDALVEVIEGNYMELADAVLHAHVAASDLLILATDRFAAQARGNELALQFEVPSLWVGLYVGGTAGEIVFWRPGIDACFRCLCAHRYKAQEAAEKEQRSLDPASDGCTIFDVAMLDAIGGMVGIGLLTHGSDNRFGRMIELLGDRNFIQVQLDSSWDFGGTNPIRKYLGVDDDCPAYFAWNTIVRADPDCGQLYCPDCEKFRGHSFVQFRGVWSRIRDCQTGHDANR
jgi:molybdopterin/thiamine biosynthesis adenylyltransferase